jgi:hypothetical protein
LSALSRRLGANHCDYKYDEAFPPREPRTMDTNTVDYLSAHFMSILNLIRSLQSLKIVVLNGFTTS